MEKTQARAVWVKAGLLKELSVGLTIGILMGLAAGGIAYAWQGNLDLSIALFSAMICTLALTGLLGAAVPLLLKAIHQDPALGSGVIVIAINDAFAFFSFLGIATLLLDHAL